MRDFSAPGFGVQTPGLYAPMWHRPASTASTGTGLLRAESSNHVEHATRSTRDCSRTDPATRSRVPAVRWSFGLCDAAGAAAEALSGVGGVRLSIASETPGFVAERLAGGATPSTPGVPDDQSVCLRLRDRRVSVDQIGEGLRRVGTSPWPIRYSGSRRRSQIHQASPSRTTGRAGCGWCGHGGRA